MNVTTPVNITEYKEELFNGSVLSAPFEALNNAFGGFPLMLLFLMIIAAVYIRTDNLMMAGVSAVLLLAVYGVYVTPSWTMILGTVVLTALVVAIINLFK